MRGTVKWFSAQRGYGFITGEDDYDYFVHFSGINGDGFKKLRDKDEVTFDIVDGEKGLMAANVTRVNVDDAAV